MEKSETFERAERPLPVDTFYLNFKFLCGAFIAGYLTASFYLLSFMLGAATVYTILNVDLKFYYEKISSNLQKYIK